MSVQRRHPEPIFLNVALATTDETSRYKLQAVDGYRVEVGFDFSVKDGATADITATLYERSSGRALVGPRSISLTANKYACFSMNADMEVPPQGFAVLYVKFSATLDVVDYTVRIHRRPMVKE